MYSHTLSNEVIRENAIEIMKAKDQYDEVNTKINIERFSLDKCEVFLIEVNLISSTMILSQNWPKQLLKTGELPAIFVFRADMQTSGRGQRQNQWISPEGNLYLTLLIKIQFTYFPYLPIIAVSNVFKVIKTYLDQAKVDSITKIKWINDIVIDFQKVSGVLIKNEMLGQCLFTQIGIFVHNQGIGLNIKKVPQFSLNIMSQSVTCLEKHTQTDISLKELTLKMIETFVQTFFRDPVEKVKIESKKLYESNLAYLKKEVLIYDHKYEKVLCEGIFEGINEYGHAIIKGSEEPFAEGRMKVQHNAF